MNKDLNPDSYETEEDVVIENEDELVELEEILEEDFTMETLEVRRKLLLRVRVGAILLVLFYILRRFDPFSAFNPINGNVFTLIGILVLVYCVTAMFVVSTFREHELKKESVLKRFKSLDSIYDYISIVPYVLVVFTVVNMFFISFSPISGSSMEPNFSDDEAVIFSHMVDGYERLDVVIVYVEEYDDPYLIKRVIGLPNETVTIDHNVITITDKDGNEFILDQYFIDTDLVDTVCYNSIDRRTCSWTLGSDEYFVLGDNRDGNADLTGMGGASLDSRSFGEVYVEDIYGKVIVTFKDYNLLK